MKQKFTRVLVFCLSLGLCLTALLLTAFGTRITFEAPFTTVTCFDIRSRRVDVALSEEEQAQLLGYLNKKQWHEGADTCVPDYEFHSGDTTLTYHSICGQVVDCESNRSCSLSKQDRQAINTLLQGISSAALENESADSVDLYYFRAFNGWLGEKAIHGPLATELLSHLSSAAETGEIEAAPHDDTTILPPVAGYVPHHLRRTYWILANDTLYRCRENLSLVESYAGEGKVLEKTEEITDLLHELWHYHPYDYYTGVYYRSKDELQIQRAFHGESDVHLHVKSLNIKKRMGSTNTLVLELYSETEQTLTLDFWYWSGTDVFVDTQALKIEFNGTDPVTVRLRFDEHPSFGTQIYLSIGKTRATISVRK